MGVAIFIRTQLVLTKNHAKARTLRKTCRLNCHAHIAKWGGIQAISSQQSLPTDGQSSMGCRSSKDRCIGRWLCLRLLMLALFIHFP